MEKANNMKAIREALESFIQLADDGVIQPRSVGEADEHCFCRLMEMARAALATPPRNCDIGTADEQYSRMYRKCYEWMCADCKASDKDFRKCALSWAQMPCEESGAGTGERRVQTVQAADER